MGIANLEKLLRKKGAEIFEEIVDFGGEVRPQDELMDTYLNAPPMSLDAENTAFVHSFPGALKPQHQNEVPPEVWDAATRIKHSVPYTGKLPDRAPLAQYYEDWDQGYGKQALDSPEMAAVEEQFRNMPWMHGTVSPSRLVPGQFRPDEGIHVGEAGASMDILNRSIAKNHTGKLSDPMQEAASRFIPYSPETIQKIIWGLDDGTFGPHELAKAVATGPYADEYKKILGAFDENTPNREFIDMADAQGYNFIGYPNTGEAPGSHSGVFLNPDRDTKVDFDLGKYGQTDEQREWHKRLLKVLGTFAPFASAGQSDDE